MNPARYETTSVKIDASGYRFHVSASKNVFDGFLAVYDLDHEKNENNTLLKSIDKDTSCISASFGQSCTSNMPIKGKGQKIQSELENHIKCIDSLVQTNKLFRKISNKVRFLIGAGNNGNCSLNIYLLSTGLEGVGGLNSMRKVHFSSSSRNSFFTQHYENYEFPIKMTKEGLSISGLHGTDIPITKTISPGKSFGKVVGTSCATPVRAAKLALNEMMEGLL